MTRNKIMLIGLTTMAMLLLQACNSGEENKSRTQSPPATAPPSKPVKSGPGIGDKVILDNTGTEVTVAVTEADMDDYFKVLKAEDYLGAAEMGLEGRIYRVDDKTLALVLEVNGIKVKVRILSGKDFARTGWVMSPNVKPDPVVKDADPVPKKK